MFDTVDDDDGLTPEERAYALDYSALLANGEDVLLDQRQMARALFDKGVEFLDAALPPDKTLTDLLASFELSAMHGKDPAPILYPSVDAGVAGAPGAAGEAPADPDSPGLGGFGVPPQLLGAPVPKNAIHVSASATLFQDWHIPSFPSGPYESPYSVVLDDDKPAAIKKARAMLPVVPHGTKGVPKRQYAGTMAWTTFTKTLAGWMYVEPRGDYQDYFWGRVHQMYNDEAAKADLTAAEPGTSDSAKMAARARQRNISAAAATCRQEGLPPSINCYDSCLLTWCSGLAAPGLLNKVWNAVANNANCAKAMYLCGFLYQGNSVWGEFQVADVESEVPRVYHRGSTLTQDVINRDTGKVATPRGGIDYGAYKVLSVFTDQIELLYMLIALARDPLTRDVVFDANFAVMSGMVDVAGAENLASEALYVFIAEVQHNWSLTGRSIFTATTRDKLHRPSSIVAWAIAHFSDDEKALRLPSAEGDRAIAKGAFRFVLRCLQEDAWNGCVARLKTKCKALKTNMLTANDAALLSSVRFMYGLDRLVDNYWTPMQTGVGPAKMTPHSIDGSTLAVPDFPKKLASASAAAPGEQVVQNQPGADAAFYAIGTQTQADFLFPHDVQLFGLDTSGNVVVEDAVTKERWSMHQDKVTQQWSRVQ
jgi:hypothetical protein